MVHGISRAVFWLFTFSLNLASKTFMIPTRYNCTYKGGELLKALTYLSLETEYAEGGLKALEKRIRRHQKAGRVPDADALLYRLKKMDRSEALSMLQEMDEKVLSMARRKGAFRRRTAVAIGLNCTPYCGKPSQHVVPGKYKLGTNWFHCHASIRLVERGRRYTIKSRPINHFELNEKAKIVEEPLSEVRRQGVHIRLLLLDRGFYTQEVIKTLKAMGIKFLMAVPKNERVKETWLTST